MVFDFPSFNCILLFILLFEWKLVFSCLHCLLLTSPSPPNYQRIKKGKFLCPLYWPFNEGKNNWLKFLSVKISTGIFKDWVIVGEVSDCCATWLHHLGNTITIQIICHNENIDTGNDFLYNSPVSRRSYYSFFSSFWSDLCDSIAC